MSFLPVPSPQPRCPNWCWQFSSSANLSINYIHFFFPQMKLERAEWGNDLPSVELQLETQQHIHASVEELGSSVKEARLYEVGSIQNPLWAAGVAVRWSSVQGSGPCTWNSTTNPFCTRSIISCFFDITLWERCFLQIPFYWKEQWH